MLSNVTFATYNMLERVRQALTCIQLKNYRDHIKRAFCSCEITEHFLLNPRTHNFNLTIKSPYYNNIIEQIKRIDMTVQRKKELLRKREIFWQSRLTTLQPTGLNKCIG